MIDLKPYGAFIEYTVRPLLEEVKVVLDKSGMKLSESTLIEMLKFGVLAKLIETIGMLLGTAIVAYTAYRIVI